ncbi:hypothetical protein KFE25_002947 [Diacronema lutheri]|uniref:Uncharacterized protein n=2 Tax=Diacronema lutheri TaxID=2081491 RepID=A0A8J5XUG4_DIALT|nr:hypothetical protein KFE25_002947 [Diacronema lutheri]
MERSTHPGGVPKWLQAMWQMTQSGGQQGGEASQQLPATTLPPRPYQQLHQHQHQPYQQMLMPPVACFVPMGAGGPQMQPMCLCAPMQPQVLIGPQPMGAFHSHIQVNMQPQAMMPTMHASGLPSQYEPRHMHPSISDMPSLPLIPRSLLSPPPPAAGAAGAPLIEPRHVSSTPASPSVPAAAMPSQSDSGADFIPAAHSRGEPPEQMVGTKRMCEQFGGASASVGVGTCTRTTSCRKEQGHAGRCGLVYPSADERKWLDEQIDTLDDELAKLEDERDKLHDEATTIWAMLSKACVLLCRSLHEPLPETGIFQSSHEGQPSVAGEQAAQPRRAPVCSHTPPHARASCSHDDSMRGAAGAASTTASPHGARAPGSAPASPALAESPSVLLAGASSVAAHAPGAASPVPHASSAWLGPATGCFWSDRADASPSPAASSARRARDAGPLDRSEVVARLVALSCSDAENVRAHKLAHFSAGIERLEATMRTVVDSDERARRLAEIAEHIRKFDEDMARSREGCAEETRRDAEEIAPHMLLVQAMGPAAAAEVLTRRAARQ